MCVLGMDPSTTRKYKSGYTKRKEQKELDEQIRKLPKLTNWITKPTTSSEENHKISEPKLESAPQSDTPENKTLPNEEDSTLCDTGNDTKDRLIEDDTTRFDFETDIGKWPIPVEDDAFIDYWLAKCSEECQNCDGDFENSAVKQNGSKEHVRHCSKIIFYRTHPLTGEKQNLKWLCYSKTTGKIYCFCCKLLDKGDSSGLIVGFNDWRHAKARIDEHSRSKNHEKCMVDSGCNQ